MPSVEFEPAIPTIERSKTPNIYALDNTSSGIEIQQLNLGILPELRCTSINFTVFNDVKFSAQTTAFLNMS
jgi:hypothetical protein